MNGMAAVLQKLDETMTPVKKQTASTVLEGNPGRKTVKSLTPEQQHVARKMNLTPEQYLEGMNRP